MAAIGAANQQIYFEIRNHTNLLLAETKDAIDAATHGAARLRRQLDEDADLNKADHATQLSEAKILLFGQRPSSRSGAGRQKASFAAGSDVNAFSMAASTQNEPRPSAANMRPGSAAPATRQGTWHNSLLDNPFSSPEARSNVFPTAGSTRNLPATKGAQRPATAGATTARPIAALGGARQVEGEPVP